MQQRSRSSTRCSSKPPRLCWREPRCCCNPAPAFSGSTGGVDRKQRGAPAELRPHNSLLSLRRSMEKTDIDVKKDLYANVCLTGGNTLHAGFNQRVALCAATPPNPRPPPQPLATIPSPSRLVSPCLCALPDARHLWPQRPCGVCVEGSAVGTQLHQAAAGAN